MDEVLECDAEDGRVGRRGARRRQIGGRHRERKAGRRVREGGTKGGGEGEQSLTGLLMRQAGKGRQWPEAEKGWRRAAGGVATGRARMGAARGGGKGWVWCGGRRSESERKVPPGQERRRSGRGRREGWSEGRRGAGGEQTRRGARKSQAFDATCRTKHGKRAAWRTVGPHAPSGRQARWRLSAQRTCRGRCGKVLFTSTRRRAARARGVACRRI